MKRWQVLGATAAVAFTAFAAPAQAGRWLAEDMGATRPMYSEHRFGVNDAGRAAWTTLVSGAPQARGYTGAGSSNLHSMLPAAATLSYAQDISVQNHIVGYWATSARESVRRAVLWRWTGASWASTLDLHAAVEATYGVEHQQSSAYSVTPVTPGGEIYVAGFRRVSVNSSSGEFSVPVVWSVDGLTSGVNSVVDLDTGAFQYGIAYGVTEDGVVIGGVGSSAGSYMTAAWWDLNEDANGDGKPDLNLVPGVQVPTWSTSVGNRVRRLTVNGDVGHYAVGTAFDTGGVLHGFITRIGPGGWTDTQFVLPGGANALAMDVTVGSIAGREGILPVGASNDVAGVLPDQPNTAHGTTGTLLLDIGSQSQVCDVADMLPAAQASVDMLNGAAGNTRRVGWGSGRAWVLTQRPYDAGVTVQVRDVPVRGSNPQYQYFWAQRPGNNLDGSVVWSSSAGCGAAQGCDDGALDLSTSGTAGVDYLREPFAAASGGLVRTGVVYGQPPQNQFDFVQVSVGQTAAACQMGSVQDVSGAVSLNPGGLDDVGFWCDFDGGVPGSETNVYADLTACGPNCGSVSSAIDGLACTHDQCVNGVVLNPYNPATNQCLISGSCIGNNALDPSNECRACQTGQDTFQYTNRPAGASCTATDAYACTVPGCTGGTCQQDYSITANTCFMDDNCWANNTRKPEPYGQNPCRRCQSGTNQRAWSNFGAAACCSNGTPVLDANDNAGGGALPDRNDGGSVGAVTTLSGVNDNNEWSYTDCISNGWGGCSGHNGPFCSGQVRTGTARFNPDIDTRDWYRFFAEDIVGFAGADTSGNPEPRVRLTLQNNFTAEICTYAVCNRSSSRVNNSAFVIRDGATWGSIFDGASGTPAQNGRGRCRTITGNGAVADMEIHLISCDGNNIWNTDNEGWMVWSVRAVGATNLECTATNYRMRWGNDQQGGSQSGGAGCATCCN